MPENTTTEQQPQSLPDSVIAEAWSEYLYPRSAVGDLRDPNPQSGFTRAMRVLQQWATEHDDWWSHANREAVRVTRGQIRKAMATLAADVQRLENYSGCDDAKDVARQAAQMVAEFAVALTPPAEEVSR